MKNNDADDENTKLLWIQNEHDDDEECIDYVPEGADDMGWLGYFVRKNQHLEKLFICSFTPTSGASVRDVMEPFLRGVSRNKSIQKVGFCGTDVIWGGEVFTMLTPFFKNNHNLTNIITNDCNLGDEGYRLFALLFQKPRSEKVHKNHTKISQKH
jgi:hypothetical protein